MFDIPDDIPNRTALDIEIARAIPKKGDGRLNWNAVKSGSSGISTIAIWNTGSIFPLFGMFDTTRLPRVFLTERWMAQELEKAEGIVTWNGAGFDLPVMRGATPPLYEVCAARKSVDLMAIMALIKTGCDPAKLEEGVPEDWMKMAPRIGSNTDAWINQGFGLEAVAKATLGEKLAKMDGFDGAKVIPAWQAGRYSEVCSYCLGDAAMTIALYVFAWRNGYLVSPAQGRVDIPQEVL